MKILVLNSGSSSLKATFFECTDKQESHPHESARIHIDNLNKPNCKLIFKNSNQTTKKSIKVKTHEEGVKKIIELLLKSKLIKIPAEIQAVGHRIVHGGEKFKNSRTIIPRILKEIKKISPLAPLHNPANLESLKASQKLLPKARQIAVFDTAFYQSLKPKAYLYGLPYKFYKDHQIRRYGFHGTSHQYVTNLALKKMQNAKNSKNITKLISCHLGNGSSITASINGKAVDTSMGFTPLEGPIMGTRSGTIDPAIIFHLQKKLKLSTKEIENILINKSGLLGLSQVSSDMRKVYQSDLKGNKQATLTISIFCYQIAKYIGAYAAAMNGLDGIIFTGGIGENAHYIREEIISYLEFLGFRINKKKNNSTSKIKPDFMDISTSKKKIFVIKTNEELEIAKETYNLINS